MSIYALVDSNSIVVNTIVLEDGTGWEPPDGLILVKCVNVCGLGWEYKDGEFIQPPELKR
ncbi:hypothetical protein DVP43_22030 [Yersinia enterocolitica]|nr:hypothetical protein [Yersinia enterocolitica]EKN5125932.1 hypothetical protein [Yersinia enterocolitica]EKN5136786.1 hypothetical protein [Yersinia enterocolitica]EKN5147136.1 hypothetical protein [Yersinia enterocolitica]EKN5939318.1 hypothetical protein [Yersinia enterocolitica]